MARHWTQEEQVTLLKMCSLYGKDWDKIGEIMGKSPLSVSSAYYRLIGKEAAEARWYDFNRAIEGLAEEIRKEARPRKIRRRHHKGSDFMAELCPFDLHIGKLVWGRGVGNADAGDYDVDLAGELYTKQVVLMLEAVAQYDPGRIYLIVGNDFFNINSDDLVTANATPQRAEDSRIHRTWRVAKDALVSAIDSCLQLATTEVIFVPGNHERERLFYFGEMIEALYSRTKGVIIDNSPQVRKYIHWGKVLIMLTHGNEERVDALPLIMSSEQRQVWGETLYHEVHVGHFHRKRQWKYMPIEERGGVVIRAIPPLTKADEWHYLKGYIGNMRASEALLFHKQEGPFACFTITVR